MAFTKSRNPRDQWGKWLVNRLTEPPARQSCIVKSGLLDLGQDYVMDGCQDTGEEKVWENGKGFFGAEKPPLSGISERLDDQSVRRSIPLKGLCQSAISWQAIS
jgi:hypothetical protein